MNAVQIVLDVVICIAGFLGGWILNTVWKTVTDLQAADAKLAEKVSSIEILVAGQYVKRIDMDRMCDALFAKLDRIEAKLDQKADK